MKIDVIDTKVNNITEELVIEKILLFCNEQEKKEARYICFANVHMVMEAYDDKNLQKIINNADIVAPDGMPLSWYMNKSKNLLYKQTRISGPDTTLKLCEISSKENLKLGFYGSSEKVLEKIKINLLEKFPDIDIKLTISPPFRDLNREEKESMINQINKSSIDILFVGLGCPKQEKWMFDHKDRLKCTMLGVGAAFDFIAGDKKMAPLFLQKAGLEWLYRFIQEPKRLWKRYLKHNPRFLLHLVKHNLKYKG